MMKTHERIIDVQVFHDHYQRNKRTQIITLDVAYVDLVYLKLNKIQININYTSIYNNVYV